ncbi:hypothetical protein C5Z26_04935 [Lactobacillus sp. CBA3606]|uniref:hypothetical protein n=1 Tax=Lactobacillus sp. CBA3606 TaxID=2099789 RepID=UPI000CFDECD4|nr:hypothetical protein [Lactobacillus sp. CBA3606]AVK63486.1 hypothetical protein C5Z26_04935 [Lactobacillus sp. CBA3606]
MPNYAALLGPDRYDLAVKIAQQYHLDPSQVLFGYLQVVSDVTGDQQATQADLHDPVVLQKIADQFDRFLKQRH